MDEFNVRVEYGPTPIENIAIQCPQCNKWFIGEDITHDKLDFDYNIEYARFECPVCGKVFGHWSLTGTSFGQQHYDKPIIKECYRTSDVYDGVLLKRIRWE
jgi:predicted RNA-binding Zn-ribbon protein involved in translation (DUF1610 family)